MFEIIICPLKQLYWLAEDGDMSNVAVLAVSSYHIDQERLGNFRNTLCLNFADVNNCKDKDAFSVDVAMKISAYVRNLPKELDTLFVCCDSGESRSTAMAAAIQRFFGKKDIEIWENPHYHSNPLVYKFLCSALGVQVDEGEINNNILLNKHAFQKAMQSQ